eukprot:gene3013-3461_t
MIPQEQVPKQSFKDWLKQSLAVKVSLIGFFVLLLLIPSGMIQSLIRERQERSEEVGTEISDKWSGSQLVQGPALVIPYKTTALEKDKNGKYSSYEQIINVYLMPEVLDIQGQVKPQKLHRGIFDAVVYDSKIHVKGKFNELELKKSGINPQMLLWDKAKIVIGLSDLKGLKNDPLIKLGDQSYTVEPDNISTMIKEDAVAADAYDIQNLFDHSLIGRPDLSLTKSTALNFDFELDIRGSAELNFMHLGRTTNVQMQGNWNDPSFTGRYLPENRKISKDAFSANWKMTYFNRPFPQQWTGAKANLTTKNNEAVFGVKFKLPVDQYQKTMRTAKYAILIILLTFISLLCTEFIIKHEVSLLQYILIAAAMIIYYILLLSFSEQVGFNLAYLIASVATITLISTFIAALLKNRKAALIYALIITIFYSFVYVLIQLQDLALLFGSIGLFITIAVLMQLSARLSWTKN